MRLADTLVAHPRAAGPVSDLLWHSADLEQIQTALAVPTHDLVRSLISDGGASARQAARLLPTPELVETAAQATRSKAVLAELAGNPAAGQDWLNQQASAGSARAAAQLELRDQWRSLSDGDLSERIGQDTIDVDTLAVTAQDRPWVLSQAGVDACQQVLDRLQVANPRAWNQACSYLSGVIDPAGASATINVAVAGWLTRSNSLAARTSREIIADQPSAWRSRATVDAAGILYEAGLVPTARARTASGSGEATSLTALEAAGCSANEVAAVALNCGMDLTSDQIAGLLIRADLTMSVNFVCGQGGRDPRPGDITALMQAFGKPRRALLASRIPEEAKRLPWFSYLAMEMPVSFLDNTSAQALSAIAHRVDAALGERLGAWQFCLALAGEWEGSLHELMQAAEAIDAEACAVA